MKLFKIGLGLFSFENVWMFVEITDWENWFDLLFPSHKKRREDKIRAKNGQTWQMFESIDQENNNNQIDKIITKPNQINGSCSLKRPLVTPSENGHFFWEKK